MSEESKRLEIQNGNIRELVATTNGRAFLWEVLAICDIYSPASGKYAAGKRAVGLEILGMLEEASPTIYPNLIITMQDHD